MDPVEKYVFRQYDPRYPGYFSMERSKLEEALGKDAAIEHVGSTAIPGLGGKGILDILIGTRSLGPCRGKLERTGYEFHEKASTPDRLFFRRDHPEGEGTRRVHLHLTIHGGRDWKEIIAFRDYLREHPAKAREYAELKGEAVGLAAGEGERYRAHKAKFIRKVIEEAAKGGQRHAE